MARRRTPMKLRRAAELYSTTFVEYDDAGVPLLHPNLLRQTIGDQIVLAGVNYNLTYSETNVETAGYLPGSQKMQVEWAGFYVYPFIHAAASDGDLAAMNDIIDRVWWQLDGSGLTKQPMGKVKAWPAPCLELGYAQGDLAAAAQANVGFAHGGVASVRRLNWEIPPSTTVAALLAEDMLGLQTITAAIDAVIAIQLMFSGHTTYDPRG